MKMSTASFERLKAAIVPFDTEERRQQYRDGKFYNADRVKDLDMRYRWDLLHFTRFQCSDLERGVFPYEEGFFPYLYDVEDLNDTNIDTALKKIVPPLNREAA